MRHFATFSFLLKVPSNFRYVVEQTLREFFKAIQQGKDQEQSWKKAIYKVILLILIFITFLKSKFKLLICRFFFSHLTKQIIARLDDPVPEYFKSPNFLEQLEWLTKNLTPPLHLSGVNVISDKLEQGQSPPLLTPSFTHPHQLHPHPFLLNPHQMGLGPFIHPPQHPFLTPPGFTGHFHPGTFPFGGGMRRPFFMNYDLYPSPNAGGGGSGRNLPHGGIMSMNSQPIITSSNSGSTNNSNNTTGGHCYLPISPPWR
jgi:hypothetical protein